MQQQQQQQQFTSDINKGQKYIPQTKVIVNETKQYSQKNNDCQNKKITQIFEDEFRQRIDLILHENHQQLNLSSQLVKQLETIKAFQVDRNEEILRALKYYKNFHTHSPERCSHSQEKRSISPQSKSIQKQKFTEIESREIFDKLTQYKTLEFNYFQEEFQDLQKPNTQAGYKKLHSKDQVVIPELIRYHCPPYTKTIFDFSKQQALVIKQYIQKEIENNIDKVQFKKSSLKQPGKYSEIHLQKLDQELLDLKVQINQILQQQDQEKESIKSLNNEIANLSTQFNEEKMEQQQQFQQQQLELQTINQQICDLQDTSLIDSKNSYSNRPSNQNISSNILKKRQQQRKQSELVEKHAMINYFRAEFVQNFQDVQSKFESTIQEYKFEIEEKLNQLKQEFEQINHSSLQKGSYSGSQQKLMKSEINRAEKLIENISVSQLPSQQQEEDSEEQIISEINILKKQNDAFIEQTNDLRENIVKLQQWMKELHQFNTLQQTQYEQRLSEVQSQHETLYYEQESQKQAITSMKQSVKFDTLQNLDNSFRSEKSQSIKQQDIEVQVYIKQLEYKFNELQVEVQEIKKNLTKINKGLNSHSNLSTIQVLQQLFALNPKEHKPIINKQNQIELIIPESLQNQITEIKNVFEFYDNNFFSAFSFAYLKLKIMSQYEEFQSFIEDVKALNFVIYQESIQIHQAQFSEMRQLFILFLIQTYNENTNQRLEYFTQQFNNQEKFILSNIFIRSLFNQFIQNNISILTYNSQVQEQLDYQLIIQKLKINLKIINITDYETNILQYGEEINSIYLINSNFKYYIGTVN